MQKLQKKYNEKIKPMHYYISQGENRKEITA